jgi:hypothetical protein
LEITSSANRARFSSPTSYSFSNNVFSSAIVHKMNKGRIV